MEHVLKAMMEKHMIEQGDRVLVGVSGGADLSACFFFYWSLESGWIFN